MNSTNQSIRGNGNFVQTSKSSGNNVVQINNITITATENKLSIFAPNTQLIIEVNGIKYTPQQEEK